MQFSECRIDDPPIEIVRAKVRLLNRLGIVGACRWYDIAYDASCAGIYLEHAELALGDALARGEVALVARGIRGGVAYFDLPERVGRDHGG